MHFTSSRLLKWEGASDWKYRLELIMHLSDLLDEIKRFHPVMIIEPWRNWRFSHYQFSARSVIGRNFTVRLLFYFSFFLSFFGSRTG